VFGAVLAGSLLVALAAAAAPLFTTAAGSAALETKLGEISRFGAGVELRQNEQFVPDERAEHLPLPTVEERDEALRAAFADVPFVDEPVHTALTAPLLATSPESSEPIAVTLMARTGALEQVERVSGTHGAGLWLADTVATGLRVTAGDTIELRSERGGGEPQTVRVVGTYRALESVPQTGYWRNFTAEIYPPDTDSPAPPPFAFVDDAQLATLYEGLGGEDIQYRWEFPLANDDITLAEAKALDRQFSAIESRLARSESPLARGAGCAGLGRGCEFHSSLSAAITLADQNIGAISPPATLVASAATLIALGVVAGAAVFLVTRRQVETRLLFVRGTAASWFAARTVVEALLPVLVGGAAGFGLSLALVELFERRGSVDGDGLWEAALAAGTRVAAGLVLLAVVAAFAFLRQYETGLRRSTGLARIPWELLPLGLAVWAFLTLRSGGGLVEDASSDVAHPSLAVFLLPVLLAAGIAGLVARLVQGLLSVLVRRQGRLPAPLYLALRRLATARGLAVVLVCGSAVALGTLVYAQTLVATLDRTVEVKAHVAKGSDVQGTIDYTDDLPARFPFPLTKVSRKPAGASLSDSGAEVDLIAVDPQTLARAAYWEASWGPPLTELANRLDRPSGNRLPLIVAGGVVSSDSIVIGGKPVPVEVVASVEAFPLMTARRPMVVSSYTALERALEAAGVDSPLRRPGAPTLVLGKGPPRDVARALDASTLRPYYLQTTEDFLGDPDVEAETRTFSFLSALGVVAGLLAVVGLVLYLQSRQRRDVVAVALSRRMGFGDTAQALALALELGTIFLVALGVAAGVSLTAARLVAAKVDPLAKLPPGPLFHAPLDLVGLTVLVLLCVSALGGLLASRAAARTDFAEVMRLGQ
jgi:putative ABC transport system permease protein